MKLTIFGNVLIDLAGTELSIEDIELLKHPAVAGVVLFTRNYESLSQLRALNRAIIKVCPHAMITVDQEGGRVQRFREGFSPLPTMQYWGTLYRQDPEQARQKLKANITTMVMELQAAGVTVNLIPVLDINYGVSQVIGDRSIDADPDIIIALASIIIETLHLFAWPAVGKHFPGHGAVVADSHLALPQDDRSFTEIWQADLKPFITLAPNLDMIMPGHIVFPQVDPHPVTFSRFWLQEILREKMGFTGVIISDDLTMEGAAKVGGYAERANLALEAGCDLLIVCNNRPGAIEMIESSGVRQSKFTLAKERLLYSI